MVRNIERQFRSKANDQSASVASSSVPWCTTPAQLNRMSTRPTSCAAASIAAGIQHIQTQRADQIRFQTRKLCGIHIGGDDLRAGGGEGLGGRPSNALARRGYKGCFTGQ